MFLEAIFFPIRKNVFQSLRTQFLPVITLYVIFGLQTEISHYISANRIQNHDV